MFNLTLRTYLQLAGILAQENFAVLVTQNHAALISAGARQSIWSRIPRALLTQANFERLVTASEHTNSTAEPQRILHQILDVQTQVDHAAALNPEQSAHTLSVNRLALI